MKSHSDIYKNAGVDIEAGYRGVELIKAHVARTRTGGVVGGIGGFGGAFAPELAGVDEPILISGTDGVGTKLKLAFLLDKHDSVGVDCVAMCVNDVVCAGAKPLFFLDYIALGKNEPERVEKIVKGVADGCIMSECALIGGETAEMPGFYPKDEYDLAGFCVGLADKKDMLSGESAAAGDVILALPSSGIHSNGFSLIRRVFGLDVEMAAARTRLGVRERELGMSLGESLLTPTRIYVKPVLAALERKLIKSLAHITGGGFYENIPRALNARVNAKIERAAIEVLPIFDLIRLEGGFTERDMFNTFNMGVGMTAIVSKSKVDEALDTLRKNGADAYVIGEIVSGSGEVSIC